MYSIPVQISLVHLLDFSWFPQSMVAQIKTKKTTIYHDHDRLNFLHPLYLFVVSEIIIGADLIGPTTLNFLLHRFLK